jgi:hypothetical protein
MKERVTFQIKDRGVLKTKSKEFDTVEQACTFFKSIKKTETIFGRPVMETIYGSITVGR